MVRLVRLLTAQSGLVPPPHSACGLPSAPGLPPGCRHLACGASQWVAGIGPTGSVLGPSAGLTARCHWLLSTTGAPLTGSAPVGLFRLFKFHVSQRLPVCLPSSMLSHCASHCRLCDVGVCPVNQTDLAGPGTQPDFDLSSLTGASPSCYMVQH